MRTLVSFISIIISVVIASAEGKLEVGEWVQFKGTTEVGPQTIQMMQKYAVVGEEKGEAGDQLMWFETDMNMSGNQILIKVLIPAKAFEEEDISSADFYKQAKR